MVIVKIFHGEMAGGKVRLFLSVQPQDIWTAAAMELLW
jgi:hypothetical protein